jgi:hypothetical protein
MKAVRQTTAIFLGRLSKSHPPESLDERSDALTAKVANMDSATTDIAGNSTLLTRIGNLAGALTIALVVVIIGWAVGFETFITEDLAGDQQEILITLAKIFFIAIIVASLVRGLIALLWFIPKFRVILLTIRRIAFQLLFVLSGVFLLPILSMILRSTDTKKVICPYNHFMDFYANTPSFVNYFIQRTPQCVRCTEWSKYLGEDDRCRSICTFNISLPLEYKVLKDAEQVTEDDLSRIYLIPINLLEVYFLAVFMQIQRMIFTRVLDLVELLPAPTRFLEAKFGSILQALQTKAGYIFGDYRHKRALFYFTFTQIKLFVLFFASLFPIFPVEEVKEMSFQIIPWMFFIASFIIAMTQFIGKPYISILHNWVNGVGYLIGGISAMIAALVVTGLNINPLVGDVFYILLFVGPIFTALVVPLFGRKEIDLIPTSYHLADMVERDRALTRSLKKKMNKAQHLVGDQEEEEDRGDGPDKPIKIKPGLIGRLLNKCKKKKGDGSEGEEEEKEELSYDPTYKVFEFSLASLAPIHVQRGINKKVREMAAARDFWFPVEELIESDMVVVVKEMFDHSNHILDVTSFNSLVKLLEISIIFVSACAGWGLGAGTAIWKLGSAQDETSLDYYLRCNAQDGIFPPYGSY